MPRNSSGTFTLAAGNPVVADTLIATGWANPTLDDIASALTDSLSRSGSGSMLAPFRLYDGTLAQPGLAFNAESSSGLYRASAGVLGLGVLGVQVVQLEAAKVSVQQNLAMGPGKSISGTGTTSGAWAVGINNAALGGLHLVGQAASSAVSVDLDGLMDDGLGTVNVRVFRNTNTTGARLFQILRGDNTNTVDHQFSGAATGNTAQIARNGGRTLIGTTTDNTIDGLQIANSARVRSGSFGGASAAAAAGYDELVIEGSGAVGMTFLSPNNVSCGLAWGDPQALGQGYLLYNHAADQMLLGAAAATNLILDAAYTRSTQPFYVPDGTAAAPSIGFMTQATWGLFRVPAIGLGMTVAGVECARFAAAGITLSAGAAALMHNDTTSYLALVAAASVVDATARLVLYDSAHATLARQAMICGRPILFCDAAAATEKGRFTAATDRTELLIGTTANPLTAASRGQVTISGATTAALGLAVAGVIGGNLYTDGNMMQLNAATGNKISLTINGVEAARVDPDQTMRYSGIEVGWRDIPQTAANQALVAGARGMVVPVSAAYTIPTGLPANSTVCLVNTTAAAITLTGFAGLHLGGTTLTGNRTLAAWGFCTIWYQSTTVAFITGNVS